MFSLFLKVAMTFLYTMHINKSADQFKAVFLFRAQRKKKTMTFMPTIPNLTEKNRSSCLPALENCAVNREILLLH